MLVLHAFWDTSRLHIWAESSTLQQRTPICRGRLPKRPKPGPHPFALPGHALGEMFPILFGRKPQEIRRWTVLLPATRRGPVPSPWLLGENGEDRTKPTHLVASDIDTLTFDPYPAIDLMLEMPAWPPKGLAYSSSLSFWINASRLSLELITKGKFVPEFSGFKAGWAAVIDEDDLDKTRAISDAMPPSCRAFCIPGVDGPQPHTPEVLLKSFLDRTADSFVRRSLESLPLTSPRRGRPPKTIPLAQQFLGVVSSNVSDLRAPPDELKSFLSKMQSWLSRLRPRPSESMFCTCFRLDPPAGEGETDWSIRFFLQAKDDRSLLVPAEQIWRARSGTVTFLKRRLENPQEMLLADLGRAAKIYKPIEDGLQDARPVGLTLTNDQAYAFLKEAAPLLEQEGYGVLLPAWWDRPAARLGLCLKMRPGLEQSYSTGLFGLDSVVSFDWEVALGDRKLSEKEFEQLARLKVPLVKVRGEWVVLRKEDIDAAISFFKKKQSREMSMAEALRLFLLAGKDLSLEGAMKGLPVLAVESEGRLRDILAGLASADGQMIAPVEIPATFHGHLRPYQERGVSWMRYLQSLGLGTCLADDMGLGKTVELIAFLLHQQDMTEANAAPFSSSPTLLICPMSVAGNWQKEIERFAPSLRVMLHHGARRHNGMSFADEAEKHDVIITTYATAQRDEKDLLKVVWENVVLDEAQNIKNPAALQTQAIKKLKAKHRIALTGTPVENRLSELWSIMDFLNPSFLRSAKAFQRDYSLPIERYRNTERADTLKRIIRPFVLRRLKTDRAIIKDLPAKSEAKVYYTLTHEQASLYAAVVEEMLERIDGAIGIERKGLVLALLMRLKQVCNHPAQFLQDGSPLAGRSGKLTRLEEMLDEVLASGDRALVFTQFAGMGAMLRHHLQERLGCEMLFLHGGTPKYLRDEMIQRFQDEKGGPPVFILSIKAGGFGLNLTAANHVFHFDRWWNPAVENQATDRAFRIGQKKNVFVHKFVCIGTLEERIDRMLEMKRDLADSVVGTGEGWLTELSTSELEEVFRLSQDAVVGD